MVASVSTAHQQRIADAQQRRLEALELQAAEYGYATPPQIVNEIADLRAELAGQAAAPEPISDEERYRATMRAVMLLSQQLAAVEVKVDRQMWLLPLMLLLFLVLEWAMRHL